MAALTSIDEDDAAARAQARRAIVGLFHPIPHPYYDHLLREQGYAHVADAATELAPQKRWQDAMATIDDELLDRLTFTGTPAHVAARFAEYDGLADEIICLPLAGGPAADDGVLEAFALARRG
jgi:alkanesulfonate monooxygenase SsuD/methylene tetrahydromethanopterin reductase-like flavin-dependent oxidoreductase (luciferase family)